MPPLSLRTLETADDLAKPVLQELKNRYGAIPNFYAGLAIDGATLNGYLAFEQAIEDRCLLTVKQREMISLAVANANGCHYCVSGHTFSAGQAGLDKAACLAIQQGQCDDATDQLILDVALEILQQRGRLSAGTWRAYRQAGLGEALLVQICAWVGINSFSNWLNNLVEPKIDFPRVPLQ